MLKYQKAFTLIELMVTVAVAAIVLGLAIPSFNTQIRNNASSALGGELVGALGYARAEAIKRAARVSICPSSNGTSCLTAADWAKGWMVFVDGATTDAAAAVIVTTPLRYWDRLDANAVMTLKQGAGGTDLAFARFTGRGLLARSTGNDTADRVFDVRTTGCKGNNARQIIVGTVGMVRSSPPTACP